MTATALLADALAAGLTLHLDPPDRIKVRGDAVAVARWTPILRPHKAALATLLADRRATTERATVLQYLGGLPTVKAQEVAELAGAYYSHHWSCPTCRAGTHVGSKLHRPCPAGAALWAAYQAAGRGGRP